MNFDERSERNLKTLLPKAEEKARQFLTVALEAMARHGLAVRIISGTRTYAEQDALYAQGRTAPGQRVTNARGGYSNHNFGIAWDIGLFRAGRYLEDSPLYRDCGEIGESLGLEWGGRWKSFRDEPHFQLRTGLSLAELRERVRRGQPII